MKDIYPRETALKILYEIENKGAYANIALKKYLQGVDYKTVDRNFITELVYGIIKMKLTIDYVLERYSTIKIKKISPWILHILRMGIYQILYLDKVPDSAACNEAVKLSKKYGHAGSVKFVNAVLRSISRSKKEIRFPDKMQNPVDYLKVVYSHPEWMIRRWIDEYGFDFTESLCSANNKVPDLCVRTNTLKCNRDTLAQYLHEENVVAVKGKYCEEALILNEVGNISSLSAFKQGLFQVQDESSMLVSRVLDPEPENFVMDVCCAPGGKITHIGQLMHNKGQVLGWDVHPHKISLVEAAVKRLGLENISVFTHDATVLKEEFIGKADRVLVDAPCSGLGIIRRKPDIKWNKVQEELKELTEVQKRILKVSSEYVKPGGYLVYSTCTIQHEENYDVVEEFVKNNPRFVPVNIERYFPEQIRKNTMKNGYVQLFPNTDDLDGFFICKLKRLN
ncbi:MAG: 16S rRNA (cytosine(967)-C(5))-methyltransferase RsmB [Clostridiaceae bacterium]|nr:16S rRNA (cytosine(967)-C(5))-methyltransferase RsmB [Clostridiaceae bacterium]